MGTGKPAKAKAPQAAPATASYKDPSLGYGTQSQQASLASGSQPQESSLGYGSQPSDPTLGYGSQSTASETPSSWGFSGASAAQGATADIGFDYCCLVTFQMHVNSQDCQKSDDYAMGREDWSVLM